jgi:biotin carboxyl carrier protein
MKYVVERAGKTHELEVELAGEVCRVRAADGTVTELQLRTLADGRRLAITPWGDLELQSVRLPGELWVESPGQRLYGRVERVRPTTGREPAQRDLGVVRAPMAGKLLRVAVAVGERVSAGQVLAVIEAMKMENALTAPLAGIVTEVAAQAPTTLEKGALILKVEAK